MKHCLLSDLGLILKVTTVFEKRRLKLKVYFLSIHLEPRDRTLPDCDQVHLLFAELCCLSGGHSNIVITAADNGVDNNDGDDGRLPVFSGLVMVRWLKQVLSIHMAYLMTVSTLYWVTMNRMCVL